MGLSLCLLGGCASKEVKVSCDKELQPINAPSATANLRRDGDNTPVAVAQAVGGKKP